MSENTLSTFKMKRWLVHLNIQGQLARKWLVSLLSAFPSERWEEQQQEERIAAPPPPPPTASPFLCVVTVGRVSTISLEAGGGGFSPNSCENSIWWSCKRVILLEETQVYAQLHYGNLNGRDYFNSRNITWEHKEFAKGRSAYTRQLPFT